MGSIALTVIGALLLLIGGLALYAREEIVDEDAFAQRTTQTLNQEAVRHAVARELAAEVSNAGPPQLVSARPILESVFEALIDTEQFRRVFDDAALQANRLLFTREKTVVLKLEDAVTVLRSALEGANPKLAEKIPKDLQPELAKLENRSFGTKTVEFADNVRVLGIILPLDGAAGLRRRHATASRFLGDFGVAMYCGFGRQPGQDGMETMREHGRVVRDLQQSVQT